MSLDQHGIEFRDEDWYGDDLGAAVFTDCTLTEVDFSEAQTRGARFTGGFFAAP